MVDHVATALWCIRIVSPAKMESLKKEPMKVTGKVENVMAKEL